MKFYRWLLVGLLAGLLLTACGGQANLQVEWAHAHAAPAGGQTAVEFVLRNRGRNPIVIVGAQVPDAAEAYFVHEVSYEDPDGEEYERDEPSPPIEIVVGSGADFHEGGRYLLVRGLKRAPARRPPDRDAGAPGGRHIHLRGRSPTLNNGAVP